MSESSPTKQFDRRRTPVSDTGQEQHPLRSAAAQFIKELVWSCVRLKPTKRPICLYASRRSGSTLLMQMISANRGVMFSDQPFGMYSISSANINRLPVFSYSQIACPDEDEAAVLRHYFSRLIDGRIRANAPWKFWSRDFHFSNNRICLKITDAKAMIDWFDQQFDVDTVVLTRHPIAQILSVADNHWFTTGKGLLRNSAFVEQWLTSELESMCRDVYRGGTELEGRTVDWALENLVPLTLLRDRPNWLFIGYEDLVQHTPAVIEYLSSELLLDDTHSMAKQIAQPSRSVRRAKSGQLQRSIDQGKSERLLDSWKSRIAADELTACFRILEQFGIDLYRPDSSFPDHRCVGRKGFA
ncbi:MAG: hypothetical protein KDB00_27125 [Planctomycetales bacterium]|nr:hypothetical protein [Planctomycetales bacterium]